MNLLSLLVLRCYVACASPSPVVCYLRNYSDACVTYDTPSPRRPIHCLYLFCLLPPADVLVPGPTRSHDHATAQIFSYIFSPLAHMF